MTTPTPSLDAQIEALAIGFTELAKALDRESLIQRAQLPSSMESEAKRVGASEQTLAAVEELARRLR